MENTNISECSTCHKPNYGTCLYCGSDLPNMFGWDLEPTKSDQNEKNDTNNNIQNIFLKNIQFDQDNTKNNFVDIVQNNNPFDKTGYCKRKMTPAEISLSDNPNSVSQESINLN
jgi:hypothetical protein